MTKHAEDFGLLSRLDALLIASTSQPMQVMSQRLCVSCEKPDALMESRAEDMADAKENRQSLPEFSST